MDNKYSGLEVAVIGISCRFPDANNWREFWRNLTKGVESVQFTSDKKSEPGGNAANFVNAKSGLKNKFTFDADFFKYRPDEAYLMNPEHRVFHECVWEALEDSGYAGNQTNEVISLFAGAGTDLNWKVYSLLSNMKNPIIDDFTLHHLSDKDFLTSLVSYRLDLKGPSISVNTACSTSLVAINLACKSLLFGESSIALAGGVTILTEKQRGYFYEEGMVNSMDGHCRAFDKDASGSAVGEGVGVVVLKRLKDAIKDGDHIYAIIKGSAINNDGNRKVGYTAPSVQGQSECIQMAHRLGKIPSKSISLIEAHGTGTRLGDPIEIEALNLAFGKSPDHSCLIGSVKTNIGHLDRAAGVAGFIKAALSLANRQIPPSLNFQAPNPLINFDDGPFVVNTSLKEWVPVKGYPLRAGVSSFGIGGTNAHVVLEEAPEEIKFGSSDPFKLLILSANSEASLTEYAETLREFLIAEKSVNLDNVCFTLQVGRKKLDYRKTIIFKDRDELIFSLKNNLGSEVIKEGELRSVVFMFSGAGSQYSHMGKELYETNELFRQIMDKGFLLLRELTGINYLEILYPTLPQDSRINKMVHAQPLIFLFEYALAQLVLSWNIRPTHMIGHSLGEYVSACVAGVFQFEDALKLIARRGQLIDRMQDGKMLSVSISETRSKEYVSDKISLAAVNAPEQVVFSGDLISIMELSEKLEAADISWVELNSSVAGHSHMMDYIIEDYRAELMGVDIRSPKIPFMSNLTGMPISAQQASSIDYWVNHMRKTVLFSAGFSWLLNQGERLFLEIGAGHSLVSLAKQHVIEGSRLFAINLIRHPKEAIDDRKFLLEKIGELWRCGFDIDWRRFHQEPRGRISLPTYRFESIEYPTEVDPLENGEFLNAVDSQNIGETHSLDDWIYFPSWQTSLILPKSSSESPKRTTILIFANSDAFDSVLQQDLRARHNIIEVVMGEKFSRIDETHYCINIHDSSHFEKLISQLSDMFVEIDSVIYNWGRVSNSQDLKLERGNRELCLSYFAMVSMVQAILKVKNIDVKRIFVLTNSLQPVLGSEIISYGQSLLLGLVNVIPQETPIACHNIDFNFNEDPVVLVKNLVCEIESLEKKSRIVVYRNNVRWVMGFQKNSAHYNGNGSSVIRQGGVYMITGGLGNVGVVLAKHLVEHYQAKVILIGRASAIELAQGSIDSNEKVRTMLELGERVTYRSTDVGNREDLLALVQDVEQNVGKINGVIHAAGNTKSTGFQLLEDATEDVAFKMLWPKMQGIENIHSIFKDRHLDFVWVTSSISSIMGGLSFSCYSSANLFMEYFIASKVHELPNWKCVALSEMLFNEEEIPQEVVGKRNALTPREIASLFEITLTFNGCPRIFEQIQHLAAMLEKYNHRGLSLKHERVLEDSASEAPNVSTGDQLSIERKIVVMAETFFGIKNITAEMSFFELGGDSLKAMVFSKKLKTEFGISFPLRDFFRMKSLKDIAVEIENLVWLRSEVEARNEMEI